MVSGRMLRIRSRRGKNARGVLEFGGKDVIVRAYFEDDVSKQAYISRKRDVTVHVVHSNALCDAQKLHFMQFRACCPRDFGAFCAKTPRGTVAREQ